MNPKVLNDYLNKRSPYQQFQIRAGLVGKKATEEELQTLRDLRDKVAKEDPDMERDVTVQLAYLEGLNKGVLL